MLHYILMLGHCYKVDKKFGKVGTTRGADHTGCNWGMQLNDMYMNFTNSDCV